MTWVTQAEAADIAGETPTESSLRAASSAISIYCNRTEASSGSMRSRDVYWIKVAVAYQSIWNNNTVASSGSSASAPIRSVQQDGITVTYSDTSTSSGGDSNAERDLHPLAVRALKNLSWKGSHTKQIKRASRAERRPPLGQGPSEYSDWYDTWEPL